MITFDVLWFENWFYGLILISLIVWGLEIIFPWRKNQPVIRKDFWLDGFYMFFNFFLFTIGIEGLYAILTVFFEKINITMTSISIMNEIELPNWALLIIFFILNDFVQWFTHLQLHRFPILWRFHRVHHSVKEMGFAAHLRFHWMEHLFYKPLKTLVIMIIGGFEPEQAYIIHFIAVVIGHLNHANIRITWGPLKYLINNSVMHLYHHAKELPKERNTGVNFGISLSIWDYIFKTNYIPQSKNGDYELGWDTVDDFPKTFFSQITSGFKNNKQEN